MSEYYSSRNRFLWLGLRFVLLIVMAMMLAGLSADIPLPWAATWLKLLVIYWLCVEAIGRVVLPNLAWRIVALAFYPVYLLWIQWHGGTWPLILALIVLVSVLGQSWRGRVPLYLTHSQLISHLDQVLPKVLPLHMAELGSGLGTVLKVMATFRPQASIDGYEIARIPFWWSSWWLRQYPRVRVLREDFMMTDWSSYDVVYVFLSPLMMPAIWQKALTELHDDAILISNSFEVPDVAPDHDIQLQSGRQNRLMVWRIGNHKGIHHGN